MTGVIGFIDALTRETTLFASVGLLIGGIDDLLVDIVFLVRRTFHPSPRLTLADLPAPQRGGPIAVFVPAWDESAVIGGMLSTAVARYRHAEYRIYVGAYPNDPATIAAIEAVAVRDPRITLVVGSRVGPTTKADCLNGLWARLKADEAATGVAAKAIVLHDAEDYVHPDELTVFDALIEHHDVVQLPVLPLVKRGSLVSGHYADEFAEAHAKQLVVRTALGAGMPLAGTGCAIAPAMLAQIATSRDGDPFDSASLTEDYELGLRLAELGARGLFARVRTAEDEIVAVRAYFPATVGAAITQKARWMTGIALAGWDRTGWARPRAVIDHWMRMRDRRPPLSMVVLAAAYFALVVWGLALFLHWQLAIAAPPAVAGPWLLDVNMAMLVWRLATRMAFTGRSYGPREAMLSLPGFVVGNFVALLAAPRALRRYWRILRGQAPVWDKTQHDFPDPVGEAARAG